MLRCLCNCIHFVNSTETKDLAQQLKESNVYFDSQFESLLHCCDVGHVKDSHAASSGRKQRVMDAGAELAFHLLYTPGPLPRYNFLLCKVLLLFLSQLSQAEVSHIGVLREACFPGKSRSHPSDNK